MRDTSAEAYASVKPHLPKMRERVFAHIVARGALGVTSGEACDALGILVQSMSGTLGALATAGLIEDSGERRKLASGRKAIVWKPATRVLA
jgi:hypothetical protein